MITQLRQQFELEKAVIGKIGAIESFHDLFLALVKGEHIIERMDKRQQSLLKRMQGMRKIFSEELTEGITYDWAMGVFQQIEVEMQENVNAIASRHANMDFEYVNRPEFVDLVRNTIQTLRKRKVSEEMITVFVHLFREWYNERE